MTSPRATFVAVRGAGHAGYTIPVRFVEVKHLSVRMSAAFAIEITLSMCCVKDIATCFSTPLARCRGAWLGVGGRTSVRRRDDMVGVSSPQQGALLFVIPPSEVEHVH